MISKFLSLCDLQIASTVCDSSLLCSESAGYNQSLSDFNWMEKHFISVVELLDTISAVTYVYWASAQGEMACTSFDPVTGLSIQEVRMTSDGVLSNQFEWRLDTNNTNSSYPYNGTDMGLHKLLCYFPNCVGPYAVLDWLEEIPHGQWRDTVDIEQTSYGTTKVIISFWEPLYQQNTFLGLFGVVSSWLFML